MVESHTQAPFRATVNTDYINGETFFKVQQGSTKENYQYFYHPDHLGSSSYLTDVNGDVSQHVEYLPYGELFLEERNNKWNTSYLFNAKELDEETGLYYYVNRYLDSKTSVWLSVDELRGKYPFASGYNYCIGNPVKYIDPDGRQVRGGRQARLRNTANRYFLFPNGRMPLSRNVSTSYSATGMRINVSEPLPEYIKTITTAGGNEIKITPNRTSMNITGFIEFVSEVKNLYETHKEMFKLSTDIVYTDYGRRTSTNIIITDPILAKIQANYDIARAELEKKLGPIDISSAKTPAELLQLNADRNTLIEKKLGVSPRAQIQREMLLHPEKFKPIETKTTIIPEIRKQDPNE